MPERYGKAKSIYDRFNFWRADGTLDKILERLHLRLNDGGPPGHGPLVRGRDQHPRQPLGGGRGEGKKTSPTIPLTRPWAARVAALARKVHLIVDGNGIPLAATHQRRAGA